MPRLLSATALLWAKTVMWVILPISATMSLSDIRQKFIRRFIWATIVTVGDRSILYPGVKVYADCRIGNDCIIHSGTVIGSDGFGFAPTDGSYQKIPQLGNVVIEDNVEIGSNVSIDRATMGSTLIKQGVKLDNLVSSGPQCGHWQKYGHSGSSRPFQVQPKSETDAC